MDTSTTDAAAAAGAGQSAPTAPGGPAMGTVTAYAAAIVAFAYALMSLYWAGMPWSARLADTWSSSPAGAGHFQCW
jgi:hypothetical protein